MRRRCCCIPDALESCADFDDWKAAHGWDGTHGNASLTISGNSCGLSGNNGTFSLAPDGPTPGSFKFNGNTTPLFGSNCITDPRFDVIVGCSDGSGRVGVEAYYGGNKIPKASYFPFPVDPSDIFGATIVLGAGPQDNGGFGTWTVTLP